VKLKGQRQIVVGTIWGVSSVRVKRWQCKSCGRYGQHRPPGLDSSGLSPKALERLLDLCIRLPYREAQAALEIQGLELEVSHCERLSQAYGACSETLAEQYFTALEQEALTQGAAEVKVVQADGVYVLEKDKPVKGQCEGREVKQMLVYPLNRPQQRSSIAVAKGTAAFSPLAHGFMRHVNLKQGDFLIGIADGAAWIDSLFAELGVDLRILDVYHATSYLDQVMLTMGWDEDRRLAHRCSWQRGDINARVWLKHYLPQPEVWLTWNEAAQTALHYLETRLDMMDYFDFKAKGYPIGSGQIEGANKSVIGARMKRSGMRWSKQGINRMATMRSNQCSHKPFLDFHTTRLLTFAP
jgi:hypothetical protein